MIQAAPRARWFLSLLLHLRPSRPLSCRNLGASFRGHGALLLTLLDRLSHCGSLSAFGLVAEDGREVRFKAFDLLGNFHCPSKLVH